MEEFNNILRILGFKMVSDGCFVKDNMEILIVDNESMSIVNLNNPDNHRKVFKGDLPELTEFKSFVSGYINEGVIA